MRSISNLRWAPLTCIALLALAGCQSPATLPCPEGSDPAWSTPAMTEGPDLAIRTLSCVTSEGTKEGPTLSWFGRHLVGAGQVVDGRPHGSFVSWDVSGRKLATAEFDHGRPVSSTTWNHDGSVRSQTTYDDTGTSSTVSIWYDGGALQSRAEASGDALDGAYESWYENGKRRSKGHFAGNERDGGWTCWNETGTAAVEVTFAKGQVVSRAGAIDDEQALDACIPCSKPQPGNDGACDTQAAPASHSR